MDEIKSTWKKSVEVVAGKTYYVLMERDPFNNKWFYLKEKDCHEYSGSFSFSYNVYNSTWYCNSFNFGKYFPDFIGTQKQFESYLRLRAFD